MKKICLLLSFVVIFIGAHAQAPVNDEPCGAIDVPVIPAEPLFVDCVPSNIYSYINATLTPAIPNPTCTGGNYAELRDVWYKFTVPASGSFIINTNQANIESDYVMAVYTAPSCNGIFTQIACNDDDGPGLYPRIQATAAPGQIIYVRMFRFISGIYTDGDFKMCIYDYSINNNPTVDNTTKVGIGTTNPLAKLDVAGTGLFRDKVTFVKDVELRAGLQLSNNAGIGKILTSDASGNASWGNLAIGANVWGVNGNNIYNTNVNNVGIGTTLPSNKLTVTGNADFTGNIGIGTNSPSYPLNFANTAGDKISLAGNSTTSFGFGVQPNLMQLHTNANNSNIAFGYGSSIDFTERARIINNGTDGMVLKGRLLLQNGSVPLDVNQQPGIWLYKADNSNLLSFMGTQNNQNVGFYGGPVNNGWGFVYDAINSRVGIGTDNPTSPLEVNGQVTIDQKNVGGYGGLLLKGNTPGSNYPNIGFSIKNTSNVDVVGAMLQGELANSTVGNEAINLGFYTAQAGFGSLSQKMVIMGNGNVGLGGTPSYKLHVGTAANGLRIEGPATAGTGASSLSIGGTGDIVIDKPGQVGGRLTIKENGAIAVGGSAGAVGQVLTSNGGASSPTWVYPIAHSATASNGFNAVYITAPNTVIADLTRTITIPAGQNARLLVSTNADCVGFGCVGIGCFPTGTIDIYLNGNLIVTHSMSLQSNQRNTISIANEAINVSAGTHTIEFKVGFTSGTNTFNFIPKSSTVIAIPQ
jgi:hypothetical protein